MCRCNHWIIAVEVLSRTLNLSKAQEIILMHGRNATAYQILNLVIKHWFNAAQDAVWATSSEAPGCLWLESPCVRPTAWRRPPPLSKHSRGAGDCHVCYVCATDRLRELLGLRPITPRSRSVRSRSGIHLSRHQIVRTRRSVRAQLNRSINKGVQIESCPPADAAHKPWIDRVLLEWLHSRRLPPMHSPSKPEVLSGVVDDRLLLLARHQNRIVAFLVASPVSARNGYLIEELARSPRAPNGTSELLIDAAMSRFATAGCAFATMGLVALAAGTTATIRSGCEG